MSDPIEITYEEALSQVTGSIGYHEGRCGKALEDVLSELDKQRDSYLEALSSAMHPDIDNLCLLYDATATFPFLKAIAKRLEIVGAEDWVVGK